MEGLIRDGIRLSVEPKLEGFIFFREIWNSALRRSQRPAPFSLSTITGQAPQSNGCLFLLLSSARIAQ